MPIPQNSNLEFIKVPFSTIREENRSVQMGLVILETDLTIETEFIKFLSQDENIVPKLSLLNTRIPCNDKVTAENLTSMESHFSDSLALFPNKYQFDVVGYGCTSASLLIGDEKIAKIIDLFIKLQFLYCLSKFIRGLIRSSTLFLFINSK